MFCDVSWVHNPILLPKFLKGYYNINPPKPKCLHTWDVSKVLNYLSGLMPLADLSLKILTIKLIGLVALTTASRAQTISLLNIQYMSTFHDKIVFYIQKVIKTSRPGVPLPKVTFVKYDKPELCVVSTLKEYLKRTSNIRKTNYLFISFKTYNKVTTSTLARWLKLLLQFSGIKDDFKAHSFRSTATSVAFKAGVSMQEILDTANWTNSRTFYKFYFKDVVKMDSFASAVLK